MNERISSRFALVKSIVNEMDYAQLIAQGASPDEYNGETLLLCLTASPAQGVSKMAVLVGFIFSYLFNDPKPNKDACFAAAERLCAEIAARDDDPADSIVEAQTILQRFRIEEVMQQMEASLAQSDIPEGVIPHVVLRIAVLQAGLGLEAL